ncbi:hypothetical protein ACSQ67_023217 [Phaseolus vulgaris]
MFLKCFGESSSSGRQYPTVIEELCTHFSLDDVRKSTNNFDDKRAIGRGACGIVYKGCLQRNDGSDYAVAVKRFHVDSSEWFKNEVEFLLAGEPLEKNCVEENIDPKIKGKIAPECWQVFIDITLRCLQSEPDERPTMGEVEVQLELALFLQEQADVTNINSFYTLLSKTFIIPKSGWGFEYSRIMSGSSEKKLVRVDVSSDTIIWHPFQLNPDAPKEGIDKREYYRRKFGSQSERMEARMSEVFKNVGLQYSLSGLTGNTMDSHRLIYFARQHGLDKQHDLVEELNIGYFTQGKYIGDHNFLLESAAKVGIEGAEEFLKNPNSGLREVEEELKTYSGNITGVPYYVINGNHKLSGGQPPEVFLRAFQVATT